MCYISYSSWLPKRPPFPNYSTPPHLLLSRIPLPIQPPPPIGIHKTLPRQIRALRLAAPGERGAQLPACVAAIEDQLYELEGRWVLEQGRSE